MRQQATLSARDSEILRSIVESYIDTGEPVASRTIARETRSSLSAASIRNVMADLADEGYLSQPHTSAGRIPTLKAFRHYVNTLQNLRMLSGELARIRGELSHVDTLEGRIERSSHMLSELTRGFGIAAAIPTDSQALHQVELVALADRRVLMIVITQDRQVRNRVVSLNETLTQDELNSIRNYINGSFSGWAMADIHRELRRRLDEESALYDAILKKLILLYDKGLLEIGLTPSIHMEGAANLVGLDFHLTRERMRELFRTLEEKKRVLQLLDQFLASGDGVGVQVGLGEPHSWLNELSLIGVTVNLPGGVAAKIAVLGPVRMNYPRVMSAVYHVGQAFREA